MLEKNIRSSTQSHEITNVPCVCTLLAYRRLLATIQKRIFSRCSATALSITRPKPVLVSSRGHRRCAERCKDSALRCSHHRCNLSVPTTSLGRWPVCLRVQQCKQRLLPSRKNARVGAAITAPSTSRYVSCCFTRDRISCSRKNRAMYVSPSCASAGDSMTPPLGVERGADRGLRGPARLGQCALSQVTSTEQLCCVFFQRSSLEDHITASFPVLDPSGPDPAVSSPLGALLSRISMQEFIFFNLLLHILVIYVSDRAPHEVCVLPTAKKRNSGQIFWSYQPQFIPQRHSLRATAPLLYSPQYPCTIFSFICLRTFPGGPPVESS